MAEGLYLCGGSRVVRSSFRLALFCIAREKRPLPRRRGLPKRRKFMGGQTHKGGEALHPAPSFGMASALLGDPCRREFQFGEVH